MNCPCNGEHYPPSPECRWCKCHGKDARLWKELYALRSELNALRSKVEGIQEVNHLWDGS